VSFEIEQLEHVAGMIIHITNKHEVFTLACQLAAQLLLHIVHNSIFKNIERVKKHSIALVELLEGWILVNLAAKFSILVPYLHTWSQPLAKVFVFPCEPSQAIKH